MGKKRKAGGKPFGQTEKPVEKVRTKFSAEERFDDSEDEFYAGRDKILLEERSDVKRRRRIEEDNDFLQPSDEEVLGYDEPEDDFDDDEDLSAAEEEYHTDGSVHEDDEEDEGRLGDFGASKEDYYNADNAENEVDALEEEKEARRIQQKQLESMTEADFGFDESQWLDQEEEEAKGQRTVTEKLPEPEISEDMSAEEKLKILKSRYPEFEPLAKDLVDLQPIHEGLKLEAEAAEAVAKHLSSPNRKRKLNEVSETSRPVPVAVTKYRALSAYLGVISMYFALLTTSTSKSGLAMSPSDLRNHPIVKNLVQFRQLWDSIRDVQTPAIEDISIPEEHNVDVMDLAVSNKERTVAQKEKKQKKHRSRAERAIIAAAESEAAARQARLEAAEASLADLDNLVAPTRSKASKPSKKQDDASDFGDETPLTAEEAAAKAQRKKSLRFYTSQIAQKASKRGNASRDAGGDIDLPYKERTKDRIARLNAQAEKRGNTGADLGNSSDDDAEPTNKEREAANSDDDYYQTITSRNEAKKATKSALAAAHAAAAAQNGVVTNITQTIGPDGKRGISYEIAKNKGLTPHRKKDVRNPRAKQRARYTAKMKKLGTSGQRQVYKGGEGRGGYGGETTGINRSVIRSVKL